MKIRQIASLSAIGLILIMPFFVVPSFGVVSIVQKNCAINSSLANNTNVQTTLVSNPSVNNILLVGASVQGSGNTVIKGVNITDNQNGGGLYSLIGRSVDQSNSLFVGWFNQTVKVSASTTLTYKYIESAGLTNQNLQICIYEITGLTSFYNFYNFHTTGGGTLPRVTQSATSNDFVFGGAVYNSSPLGTGHILTSNGTTDTGVQSNFSIFAHANAPISFTESGSTVAFAEESDIKLALNIKTSTITGWLFPNFANCPSGQACADTSLSWFVGFLILLVPLTMVDYVFMKGSLNVDRNVLVFINLVMLFLGALLATMVNQLPFAIPFVFGMVLVIYIWRGRG